MKGVFMMKKLIGLAVMSVMVVAGCTEQDTEKASSETGTETAVAKEAVTSTGVYVGNPQVPADDSLDEVGETFADHKGELTLLNQLYPNETIELGPIKLVVKDVKKMHLRPDYGMIDYFHVLTHDEEFDFVKMYVEVTNTSNEEVNFGPVALVTTSTGEQVIWENDIYLDGLHGTYAPGEMKVGNVGFIIEQSDIDSVTFLTSDVFDQEEKLVMKATERTYELK